MQQQRTSKRGVISDAATAAAAAPTYNFATNCAVLKNNEGKMLKMCGLVVFYLLYCILLHMRCICAVVCAGKAYGKKYYHIHGNM